MVTNLTPKQQEMLDAIRKYVREHDSEPTLRALADQLGYGQLSSVHRHVEALRSKGALPQAKAWKRGIKTAHVQVKHLPLVGSVACGTPLLAEENVLAQVPYTSTKLKSPTAQYFFLRANGNSMDRAGITDGDLLLVRQQSTANRGEKVIALIGDEATCKFLEVTNEGWYQLTPRSSEPQHKPRVMLEEFSILGVVEDVVRPRRGGNDT